MKTILIIAGLDNTTGAGLVADSVVVRDHGHHPFVVLTAITSQASGRLTWGRSLDPDEVEAQLAPLVSSCPLSAVKVGMLGSGAVARRVADLICHIDAPVVFDPVLATTGGDALFMEDSLADLWPLLRASTVVTPNLVEVQRLSGMEVRDLDSMSAAAKHLVHRGVPAVVVTGGHLEGSPSDLLCDGVTEQHFVSERLDGAPRGTGCTFSTALACALAEEGDLSQAVSQAKKYVSQRISNSYQLSDGSEYM